MDQVPLPVPHAAPGLGRGPGNSWYIIARGARTGARRLRVIEPGRVRATDVQGLWKLEGTVSCRAIASVSIWLPWSQSKPRGAPLSDRDSRTTQILFEHSPLAVLFSMEEQKRVKVPCRHDTEAVEAGSCRPRRLWWQVVYGYPQADCQKYGIQFGVRGGC